MLSTHSADGDRTLVAKEKAFIVDLRTRALGLKEQGVTAERIQPAGQRNDKNFLGDVND